MKTDVTSYTQFFKHALKIRTELPSNRTLIKTLPTVQPNETHEVVSKNKGEARELKHGSCRL